MRVHAAQRGLPAGHAARATPTSSHPVPDIPLSVKGLACQAAPYSAGVLAQWVPLLIGRG